VSVKGQEDQHAKREAAVCAVVTTFNPDPGWPERLEAVAAAVESFVVADDHSDAARLEMVSTVVRRHGGHVIQNERKVGHAGVVNQGVRWAFDQGFQWALVFDDDTLPGADIASELLRVYRLASTVGATAVVGANYLDPKTGRLILKSDPTRPVEWVALRTVITSGSLIEREAFRAIGPFREEFFVASTDEEFCLRARSMGYQVVMSIKPLMVHSIGAKTIHRIAGLTVCTTNHTAKRRYFMVRNSVTLMREYLFREPKWVVATFCGLLLDAVVVALVEEDKLAKMRGMVVGAWHGLVGRLGPGQGDAR
jgi:rhamnosyltransferase